MIVPKLGQPIAEQGPTYPADSAQPLLEMITIASPGFAAGPLNASITLGIASSVWFAANCPLAVPFVLEQGITVYQLGWYNGAAAGDNADIGIYDSAWNRLVSAGSTACVGNSTFQFVNVTDTLLPAGRYYVAFARDTTTTNRVTAVNAGRGAMVLCGVQDSATTAFPLPDPLTNMADAGTAALIPWLIIAARPLV